MPLHLIDAASTDAAALDVIRRLIEVGDRVVTFASEPHDLGTMVDEAAIEGIALPPASGHDPATALEYVDGTDPEAKVRLYSDGHFVGGHGYDAPGVRASAAFREGRLNIVTVRAGSGYVDITTLSPEHRSPVTVGDIENIITGNLFPANIDDANERLEAARIIHSLIEERMAERLSAVMPEASTHSVETTRVDGTSDVQRFDDAVEVHRRLDQIIAMEPEIVFVATIVDGRPEDVFRRDEHESISRLSPERQRRARAICATRLKLHGRRWGARA